jgi:hypothetical protein
VTGFSAPTGVAQGLQLVIRALAQAAAIPLAIEDSHSVRTFALLEAADAVRVLGFARLPEHRIAQAVWLLAEATAATRPDGAAAQPSAGAVTSAVASLEGDRLTG